MEQVTEYTLRDFSYYIPDVNTIPLNVQDPKVGVPNKPNEFYITDPLGLEILNIVDIYFSMTNSMFYNHPPMGPFSVGEIKEWALAVEVAGWVKQFSSWDYTFEFKSPNRVRISPTPNSERWISIEYERNHHPNLGTIPNDLQMFFCELALADIMIMIGEIRAKYSAGEGLKTPFGDIPLQADIAEKGKVKRDDIIEKLKMGSLPNVTIDIG